MGRDTLERKATRAVIRIDEKVSDIKNILSDLSMKVCYLIKDRRDYYDMKEGNEYLK